MLGCLNDPDKLPVPTDPLSLELDLADFEPPELDGTALAGDRLTEPRDADHVALAVEHSHDWSPKV